MRLLFILVNREKKKEEKGWKGQQQQIIIVIVVSIWIYSNDINLTDHITVSIFFADLMSTRYRKDIYQNWLSLFGKSGIIWLLRLIIIVFIYFLVSGGHITYVLLYSFVFFALSFSFIWRHSFAFVGLQFDFCLRTDLFFRHSCVYRSTNTTTVEW